MKGAVALLLAGALAAAVTACSSKQPRNSVGDDHEGEHHVGHSDHHDHGQEAAGARYAEGKGITLLDETKKAIGLELAEAEERILSPLVPVEAQVYRAARERSRPEGEQNGSAYATALVTPTIADNVSGGEHTTLVAGAISYDARVWRVLLATAEAVNRAEVILQIPDPENALEIGQFLSGWITQSGAPRKALAIPRSAMLETATGKFAFVENGNYLLRTPVITGSESADYIEVIEGLYAGDVVAASPVETLYLIELRATKGGGHSH